MKTCSKCLVTKNPSEFRHERRVKDGLSAQCRECQRAYNRVYQKTPSGRQYVLARVKKYQQATHGHANCLKHWRRKSDKRYKLDCLYTLQDEQITREIFKHQCFKCHAVDNLEIDHHNPASRGYGLSLNNAVLLCRSCNATKRDRLPQEFYTDYELHTVTIMLETVNG